MNTEEINQLRSEILDHRAASLNRWLAVMSVALAFLVIVVTVGGILGFGRINSGMKALDGGVIKIREITEEAEDLHSKIQALERQAKFQVIERQVAQQAMAIGELAPDGRGDSGSKARDPQEDGQDGDVLESLLLASEGYRPLQSTWSGSLSTQTSESQEFDLTAGQSYWFVAECDENCNDLDLAIRDDSDQVLDFDELPDDTPMVFYDATERSKVTLEVTMYECVEEPCMWKLRGYVRETNTEKH